VVARVLAKRAPGRQAHRAAIALEQGPPDLLLEPAGVDRDSVDG